MCGTRRTTIRLPSTCVTSTIWPASINSPSDTTSTRLPSIVTWLNDTGAYLIGARLGKTKLAPALSPKKTVEGALGGLAFATVTSVLCGLWFQLPLVHALILGPVLGMLGQVGDLCESAIKRDLGIKDFGGIMPGHGGILDRFDSILFTAPIAYYYLAWILRHP